MARVSDSQSDPGRPLLLSYPTRSIEHGRVTKTTGHITRVLFCCQQEPRAKARRLSSLPAA